MYANNEKSGGEHPPPGPNDASGSVMDQQQVPQSAYYQQPPPYNYNQHPPPLAQAGQQPHPYTVQQQPGYAVQYQHMGQSQQTVIVTQPGVQMVGVQKPINHGLAIGLGFFTLFCCNMCLGIPAVVLAFVAQSSTDQGSAKTFNKISIILSIVGIVTGIIALIAVIVYVVLVVVHVSEAVNAYSG